MDAKGADHEDSLGYLYKEYTRLSDKGDSYAQSSFADIQLYGGIAVLFAWKPIAEAINLRGGSVTSGILLLGFIGILLFVSIIATRDLLKQSIIKFYLQQLSIYEAEIRQRLNHEGGAFRFADNWMKYNKSTHQRVFSRFFTVFCLLVIVYPCLILGTQPEWYYALIYLAVGILIVGIYISAGVILSKD